MAYEADVVVGDEKRKDLIIRNGVDNSNAVRPQGALEDGQLGGRHLWHGQRCCMGRRHLKPAQNRLSPLQFRAQFTHLAPAAAVAKELIVKPVQTPPHFIRTVSPGARSAELTRSRVRQARCGARPSRLSIPPAEST